MLFFAPLDIFLLLVFLFGKVTLKTGKQSLGKGKRNTIVVLG